jgi:hypothetical protein
MAESGLSNLRERAENGDEEAVDELIELAPERGDMDELRHFADRGNATATDPIARPLQHHVRLRLQCALGELPRRLCLLRQNRSRPTSALPPSPRPTTLHWTACTFTHAQAHAVTHADTDTDTHTITHTDTHTDWATGATVL